MVKLSQSPIIFNSNGFEDSLLRELYAAILKPRLFEEKMLKLLRQGKISKWFSGIGQEAIAVGATKAMNMDEYIFPMHRNLGVFTTRNIPLHRLFGQFQGKEIGFTKGRDRSFHFGTNEYNIVGMISHLGPQLALADGIALANKLANNGEITLAFTGEGGTSEGDFHEALNVAAVWKLPVIFLIENNGYGLSTPTSEQYACEKLSDRGVGYGMKAFTIDGNNILEVYTTIKTAREKITESPQPILIECKTFRRRGHEEASGTKYVPQELMEYWEARDPVNLFEQFLLNENVIDQNYVDLLYSRLKIEIQSEIELAQRQPEITADLRKEKNNVFYPHEEKVKLPKTANAKELRFIDAISNGLWQGMEKYENSVIMGQDIADYGGVFKITDGFAKNFGKERVRNTPICESAIVGAALGLSIKGYKAIVEMQFSDFVTCGFNQIVNNLAKLNYRWGQNADVIIRMPCGGTVGAGPFHSQSNEAWFFHVPGLKIVYPTNPIDAKGLLLAALEDPNPVLYFEHKALYRSISAHVPVDYYTTKIGEANLVKKGNDFSIITYGLGVQWAKTLQQEMRHWDIEILDLRTLAPLDYNAIEQTVKKTGKALLLHEDNLTGGIGAEISAYISENCFEVLDAPIMRCASLDTPYPFAKKLEDQYLANSRLKSIAQKLFEY